MRDLIILTIILIILFVGVCRIQATEKKPCPVLVFDNMEQFDGAEIYDEGYYNYHRNFFFRMFNHYLPIFTRQHSNREQIRPHADGRREFYVTVKVIWKVDEKTKK